jgi:hypothetical protein
MLAVRRTTALPIVPVEIILEDGCYGIEMPCASFLVHGTLCRMTPFRAGVPNVPDLLV